MSAVNAPKPSRREKAAATRERMIVAAIDAFSAAGYVGARMGDIADRAGVAVQTLYFTFHTKAELLQHCYDYAVLGPDGVPPQAQSFWDEIARARSGRAALAAFARGNAEILARVAAIDEVARAAPHEPDAAKVLARSETLRRQGYREVIMMVAERFGLRPDVDVDAATDVLLTLGASAPYLSLQRFGWSQQRYVDWLADALATQLLARPGRR